MKKENFPPLVALLAVVLWGGTPAATKIAIISINPIIVATLRTIIAASVLLPIAVLMNLDTPRDKRSWVVLLVSSVFNFVATGLLLTIGMQYTSAAHAGIILGAGPIISGSISFATTGKWPRWIWWLGASIAMGGEILLIGYRPEGIGTGASTTVGDLIILLSAVCSCAGFVSAERLSTKIGVRSTIAWTIIVAGLVQLPILGLSQNWAHFDGTSFSAISWFSVLYLVVFTTIIGYAAWYWAISKEGVSHLSPFLFVPPIVNLIIAYAIFKEPLTYTIVISLIAIISGVAITRTETAYNQ